jgi:hypothetical protein
VNKAMRKTLTATEEQLIEEVKREHLSTLDEDELVELHGRVRRARSKYVKLYRRGAADQVRKDGSRASASAKHARAAIKAEVFEEALSVVSRRLAEVARASADELKQERLAAARAGKGSGPEAGSPAGVDSTSAVSVGKAPRGDRATVHPTSPTRVASSAAATARRQAKRDSR